MKPTKSSTLNLEYLAARKLLLPEVENVHLMLIGCGGTGSWLAPAVVRYAMMLQDKFEREVKITFVDPDRVEAKNVYRQNFCNPEIGQFKAHVLAFRYGLAWGMEILAVNEPFRAGLFSDSGFGSKDAATILIGCVDNTAARAQIQEHLKRLSYARVRSRTDVTWWLDCGNKKASGQVLLGRMPRDDETPLAFEGLCTWLPLPSTLHPDLVDVLEEAPIEPEPDDESGLSCAELAMRGSQSLSINFKMAAAAGEMLGKMLLTNDLECYAVYLDEATGETRKYITDENINAWWSAVQAIPTFDRTPPGDAETLADEGDLDDEEDG